MSTASIKGTAIAALIEDVAKCVEQGRMRRDEVERRLEAEDLELMEHQVNAGSWYPVAQYLRFSQLLHELLDPEAEWEEFVRRRGAAAAERLIHSGIYQQIDYRDRPGRDGSESIEAVVRDVKLRLSLIGSIINRGEPHAEADPDRPGEVRVELREAREVPEALAHAMAGFLSRCGEYQTGRRRRWEAVRIAPDLLHFVAEPIRDPE